MAKLVTEKLESLGLYDLEGTIDSVIERLQRLKETYKGKDISLDLRSQEYDDGKEYAVVWARPENEKETAKRLEDETKSKEYRRQQYDRLKKEFEQAPE